MGDRGFKFIVLATQRSGSTWVTSILNGFPGVSAHGELLLPRSRNEPQGWNPDSAYPRYIETERRLVRPFSVFSYLNTLYARPGTVGFKLMYSHVRLYPEVVLYLVKHRVSVIHLVRRSVLDIVVSQEMLAELGTAHLKAGEKAPENLKVRLEPDQLIGQLERIRRKQRLFRRFLSWARLRHVEVAYEDLLGDEGGFRSIWQFLCGSEEWEMPQADLARIRTGTHRAALTNYEEIVTVLAGTDFAEMLE